MQALKSKRALGERQKGARLAQVKEVFTNQDRLRENIRSFEKFGTNSLTERYLKDLDSQEDELIATRKAVAALEEVGKISISPVPPLYLPCTPLHFLYPLYLLYLRQADATLLAEMKAMRLVLAANVARVKEQVDADIEEGASRGV